MKSQENRIELVTTPGHVQPEDSATQTRKARQGFLEGEEKMTNKRLLYAIVMQYVRSEI